MAAPKKKPSIVFDKKPASPFSEKLKQGPAKPKAKAPDPKGPQMDKPANSNTKKPKASVTFKDKPAKAAAPSTRFQDAQKKAASAKSAPKPAADVKSGDLRSQALKNGGVPPKAAPASSTPKIAANPNAGKIFRKSPAGKIMVSPRNLAAGAGKLLSAGSKVLGRANPLFSQIADATPAGAGSDKPSGPLMKGNSKAGSPGTSYPKPSAAKKANPNLGYGTFNAPAAMPKATGAESAGGPKVSYPKPSTSAAPAASTSSPGFSKGSAKPPAYQAPVAGQKRGGVESRYQRDDLAMNSRKKK